MESDEKDSDDPIKYEEVRKKKIMDDMLKRYEKSQTSLKSLSLPLQSIILDDKTLDDIDKACKLKHRLTQHMYNFLKAFCIECFENGTDLPVINKTFIFNIVPVICSNRSKKIKKTKGKNKKGKNKKGCLVFKKKFTLKERLMDFFNRVYFKTMNVNDQKTLNYKNLSQVMKYETESIITSIENHITAHFYDMVNRLVNIECDKTNMVKWIRNNNNLDSDKKTKMIKDFYSELRAVKNDILNGTNKCDPTYHWIRESIIDDVFKGSENIKKVSDTLKKDSLKLLPVVIRMSRMGQQTMQSRMDILPKSKRYHFKSINIFPSKSSNIPEYMKIDTVVVLRLLVGKNVKYYEDNLSKLSNEVWGKIFNINHSVFKKFKKKGYIFNRMLSTDGFGCSLLFVRKDLYNPNGKTYVPKASKPYNYKEDKYIDDLTDVELKQIDITNVVSNDPGYHDIAYFTDGKTKVVKKNNGSDCRKTNKLRFTQDQRRFETKSKVYQKRREKDKTKTLINGESIKQIESGLNIYDSSSCMLSDAIKFIKAKNESNYLLRNYYCKNMHRYLKWSGKINKKRCDDNLIKRFINKFGSPQQVTLLYGDQDQSGMKFMEPTKGRSMRRLFKSKGFKVYLVDEFRTSKMLFDEPGIKGKGIEMENFKSVKNPRPYRRGKRKMVKSHGLLRAKLYTKFKSEFTTTSCKGDIFTKILFNRNLNAALNILQKGMCVILGQKIPKWLTRQKKCENNDGKKGKCKDAIKSVK